MRFGENALYRMGFRDTAPAALPSEIFRPYKPPKGVVGDVAVAMDYDAITAGFDYSGFFNASGMHADGIGFFGYPPLAAMAQRTEYRKISETLAQEVTREWIEFKAKGDAKGGKPGGAKADKISQLQEAFDKFRVRDVFRRGAEHDGFYGMGHIMLDVGGDLANPIDISKAGLRKGCLKRLLNIEPFWTTPQNYNASNPLAPFYYQPQSWWVQGQPVHVSRLMTIVSREMPDILKPAYNFGGLSLSQMAKPFVDNWLRTRQSVSDMIAAYSIVCLGTDLSADMGEASDDVGGLNGRMSAFNLNRDNRGLFVFDHKNEDVKILSAQIAGLDKLLAQSLEQLAYPAGIPLVKMLGIEPAGLNASSEGTMRAWFDHCAAWQQANFYDPLDRVFQIIQIHLFGDIDPDLSFEFVPLWQADPLEAAQIQKIKADIDQQYMEGGALDPNEVRERLAADDTSIYHGIDLSAEAPGLPEPDMGENDAGADEPKPNAKP